MIYSKSALEEKKPENKRVKTEKISFEPKKTSIKPENLNFKPDKVVTPEPFIAPKLALCQSENCFIHFTPEKIQVILDTFALPDLSFSEKRSLILSHELFIDHKGLLSATQL